MQGSTGMKTRKVAQDPCNMQRHALRRTVECNLFVWKFRRTDCRAAEKKWAGVGMEREAEGHLCRNIC